MKVSVEEAAALLKRGGIVAVPTETVYGLAADASNQPAVLRIFAAKNRPSGNPLICHLPDAASIARYAAAPPSWVNRFWPGPLTVLLEHRGNLAPAVTAGSRFCAFRIPAHALMHELLTLVQMPLSAPSANTSGRVSPVNAAMVENDLGNRIDGILDGGPCAVGLESTIVQPAGERSAYVLRPGAVSREMLADAGVEVLEGSPEKSPGQSKAHYAPRTPLLLLSAAPDPTSPVFREVPFNPKRTLVLSFGENPLPAACIEWNLAPNGNLDEAARRLFDSFDRASRMEIELIVAVEPPRGGIGTALQDRLLRAASYLGFFKQGVLFAAPREDSLV